MSKTEKSTALQTEISASEVSSRIYSVRGYPIMFDQDLAEMYEVEPRALKQAVRRNIDSFPSDFVFEPTKDELESLRSQSVISNVSEPNARPCLRSRTVFSRIFGESLGRGGNRYAPFAFTEHGVAMLASVLHSPRANQVNVAIIRVFIELRKKAMEHQLAFLPKLESLESMLVQRLDRIESRFENNAAPNLCLPAHKPVSVIQSTVAKYFGLTGDDLKSNSRAHVICLPRQIAIYLVRSNLGISFTEIGHHFGGRDHTTILHAFRKVLADVETNTMIRTSVNVLQNEMQNRG